MRLMLCIFACLVCGMGAVAAAEESRDIGALLEDWHDGPRDRTVPVKIDYPKAIERPVPVVVLSHGLGGSREGLAYIGQYLARHGYLAVHLQHAGSDENVWKSVERADALKALKQAASLEQFTARTQDVTFALDELTRRNADSAWPLHGKLDLGKIAMAGHSFGAVTTQAMCGQTYLTGKGFFDPRIKAGIAFSPSPPSLGDPKKAFADIRVPMFYWTGTLDVAPAGISNVTAIQRRVPFDSTGANAAYLVILTGADHMVFNGRGHEQPKTHPSDADWLDLIEHGTGAFLDKNLKADDSAAKYLDGGSFAKEVEAAGTFETKPGSGK